MQAVPPQGDTLAQAMPLPQQQSGRAKRRPQKPSRSIDLPLAPAQMHAFAQALLAWYRVHARVLPWRGIDDPYRTWLSEIMLQQTRVDAVVDHYRRFLARFPTLLALALAPEEDVLALWSGLGYYRRARMLHRAAKFLVQQHAGTIPRTAAELLALPGIGAYTSAAIASIAFGEPVAVVDGNVERVLLRIAGKAEESGAQADAFINAFAQALLETENPGDSNQAMMELGATVCLPRGPLCLHCPVFDWCRTRGEHRTLPRAAMQSARVGYALATRLANGEQARNAEAAEEILLHRRDPDLSLMPNMLELPPLRSLPETAPQLRLRHGITGTNYFVEVFLLDSEAEIAQAMQPAPVNPSDVVTVEPLASAVHPDLHPDPAGKPPRLQWCAVQSLATLPLTGLARKVLQRTGHLHAPARRTAR